MDNLSQRQSDLIQKMVKKPGFRSKIDAKCIECIYDPYQEGNWRKQVEKCTSFGCPLYPVRPVSKGYSEGAE